MKSLDDIKAKVRQKFYGNVESAELCCRMLEAAQNMKRPEGLSAMQALAALDPESNLWIQRQANAAVAYFIECLNAGEVPQ